MKAIFTLVSGFLLLLGCAHGKMGTIDQDLGTGAISKDQTIYIEPIATDNLKVSGDKAADQKKVNEEKTEIQQRYNRDIAEQLRKQGYKAEAVDAPVKSGLALTGNVTRFEHGSAAARYFVGAGAGSSNLYTDFVLTDLDSAKTLSKFEVIATSGGTSGMGSYLKAHLDDGSKKVADYIAKSNSKRQ